MSKLPNRRPEPDGLGCEAVRIYARLIVREVNDPDLLPQIPRRVAREIVDGNLSSKAVGEVLDRIGTLRETNELDCAGAFFVRSMQRLFRKHGIPWNRVNRG